MVTAGLDVETYTDAAVLAVEQERIFARHWHFVGLKSSLAAPDDWIATEIAGRGITIQNFDGELRGFRNVCSHRHARLRSECQGNGLLRCPYHGWTYNGEGVPVGIPGNTEWFGLDRAAKRALALPPIAVACCGNLVFARIAAEGPSLAAFLSDYFLLFARISEAFPVPFAEGSLDWRCNWKIGVESAIEGYHLDMVHPHSFRPSIRAALPAALSGDHSAGPLLLAEPALQSLEKLQTRLGLGRFEVSERYDHYLAFPNFCLAVSAGVTLSLQTYEPVSPGTMRLRFRLLTGESAKPALRQGVMGKAVLGAFADFNTQVLTEDQAISEGVQRGKAWRPLPPACLGANEDRLQAFHAAWRRSMEA
jgi:choline monooxygenase